MSDDYDDYDDYYDDFEDQGPAPVRTIDGFHGDTGASLIAGLWLPMRYTAGEQILAFIDGFEALDPPRGWDLSTNGDFTRFEDEYADGGYVSWMIGKPILRAYANDCGPVGGINHARIAQDVATATEALTPELREQLLALTPDHLDVEAQRWREQAVGAHVVPYGPLAGGHLLWGYIGERSTTPPEGLRSWRAINMRQNAYGDPVFGTHVAGGHDWDCGTLDSQTERTAQAERENLAQSQSDHSWGFWLLSTYD